MTQRRLGVGKYVTNFGVLGALASAASTAKRTGAMPRDWRRYVVWGVWLASLVLAIGSVAMQDRDAEAQER